MTTPEVQVLLQKVQEKYQTLKISSRGLEELSAEIGKDELDDDGHLVRKGETISASTLKRLWSYVGDDHAIRHSTLDIISRYVGYSNFNDFIHSLKNSPRYNSSFFSAEQINSADLKEGEHILMGWIPDRLVVVKYLGDNKFTVISSSNSKLVAGDTFELTSFMLGTPLYIPGLIRNGKQMPPYVAGRSGGISILKKL